MVQALQSSSFDQAPSGAIFQELRLILELHFVVKGIYHVSRSRNSCSHELARFGLHRDPGSPRVWDDPLPCFVNSLVDREFVITLIPCLLKKRKEHLTFFF